LSQVEASLIDPANRTTTNAHRSRPMCGCRRLSPARCPTQFGAFRLGAQRGLAHWAVSVCL